MELLLFDQVGETVRSLVPPELGSVHCRAARYGLKLWFDAEAPPREHYEAQVVGPRHVPEASTLAIEVGFHSEHPKPSDNADALAILLAKEKTWRKTLGEAAFAGPFLGTRDDWCRVSETWADPDLGDPDLPMELASRLADYVLVLEPIRRRGR